MVQQAYSQKITLGYISLSHSYPTLFIVECLLGGHDSDITHSAFSKGHKPPAFNIQVVKLIIIQTSLTLALQNMA